MNSYKYHIKHTVKLAYPVVIGQLGHIMMQVVDSVMVGKVGAAPLAASSLAGGLFFLIMVLGLGVSFAISPLVAMAHGANKTDECGLILRQGVIVNVILSFLLTIIMYFGADLIDYLGQPEDVTLLTISYLRILSYSILPFMMFQTFRQFSEGLTIMRPAMIIAIVANLVNVFVNWLLIFGNWGFPELGLDGAGWASFASRVFMALLMILFVLHSSRLKEYDPRIHLRDINISVIKKILNIGLPSGFQYFFEVGAFSMAAVIIGWIGTDDLAAHQVAINLASITYMVALGISAASSIRVGNSVGKKNNIEVRKAGFSAFLLVAAFESVTGVIFILLRDFFPVLYIDDSSVISIASLLLIVAAIFQISDGLQAVGLGVLRGMADVKVPTAATFFAYWIVGLPTGYFLAFQFELGAVGVWIGLLIGLTVSAIILVSRFNIISKRVIK